MDRPFALLAVALVGAAATSALVCLVLAPAAPAPSGAADPGYAKLTGRLTTLESDLGRMEQRLRDLELPPLEPAGSARPVALGTPDLAALDERLAALEAGLGTGIPAAGLEDRLLGDALVEEVSEAVELLRAQEEQAREAEREERRAERRAERLAELADVLGLDEWQLGEVAVLLEEGAVGRDEIRELYDIDGDRDAMRAGMEALEAELQARAESVLTAEQVAQLADLGGLDAFDGGGRGRGGFGGGGGGGMGGRPRGR